MIIGILDLQGAVREHRTSLERLGVAVRAVKDVSDLDGLSGIVFPGGESTAMQRLAAGSLRDRLRELAHNGFPMFGTCAGMILLANTVDGKATPHLGGMDIAVARNASGRQVHSFETTLAVKGIGPDVPAVFIRAPYIVRIGPDVDALAEYNETIVMARQGQLLVASFHPELTEDVRIHRMFVDIARQHRHQNEIQQKQEATQL
ncbi:pyridoxal 5'-phosphate synthase glutaminase subunit PdxT [Candidatus Bipolaricaulota bacterium]|nr:pyridoxal 5'-phosphate synthase glutaminase subunit PdxT [Candidatus Bipolaricaulota bacterium]